MHRGYSLFEILIVVFTLGILAAVITPRFTNAGIPEDPVRELSVTVRNVQTQIDAFRMKHGRYPNALEMRAAPVRAGLGRGFGILVDQGFVGRAPVNPLTGGSSIPEHWAYDAQTGTVTPVRPGQMVADAN